jgi:hypothetical protein
MERGIERGKGGREERERVETKIERMLCHFY